MNFINGIVGDLMLEPFLCSLGRVFETLRVLQRGVILTLTRLIVKQDWLYVPPFPFSRLAERPGGHSPQELQDSVGLDGVVDAPCNDAHDEQENQEDDPEGSLLVEPVEQILLLREELGVEQGGQSLVLLLSQLYRLGDAAGDSAAVPDAYSETIGGLW